MQFFRKKAKKIKKIYEGGKGTNRLRKCNEVKLTVNPIQYNYFIKLFVSTDAWGGTISWIALNVGLQPRNEFPRFFARRSTF